MKQPTSLQCFVCGRENPKGLHMHFDQTAPGEVTAEYIVGEEFQGYPGVVHGGVVASMLDEVIGRAHLVWENQKTNFMVTAQLNIRYRKPVPTGKPLRLVGRAGKRDGQVSRAKGEIYGPDGVLLAEGDAVLFDMPAHILNEADEEALGWKVVDEEMTGGSGV